MKKKVSFEENVKNPTEAGMSCTIDGEMLHSFMKKNLIGYLDASCNITNNDTGLYDVAKINESAQESFGNMSTMKKSKLQMKVHQVNGSKRLHVLWPMKYCTKVGANLYSLTYKLLQGS